MSSIRWHVKLDTPHSARPLADEPIYLKRLLPNGIYTSARSHELDYSSVC